MKLQTLTKGTHKIYNFLTNTMHLLDIISSKGELELILIDNGHNRSKASAIANEMLQDTKHKLWDQLTK